MGPEEERRNNEWPQKGKFGHLSGGETKITVSTKSSECAAPLFVRRKVVTKTTDAGKCVFKAFIIPAPLHFNPLGSVCPLAVCMASDQ